MKQALAISELNELASTFDTRYNEGEESEELSMLAEGMAESEAWNRLADGFFEGMREAEDLDDVRAALQFTLAEAFAIGRQRPSLKLLPGGKAKMLGFPAQPQPTA